MSKKRCSARKAIDEDLDLPYPLEELRRGEAPKNKEVLLKVFHHLRSGVKGHTSIDGAIDQAFVSECLRVFPHLLRVKEVPRWGRRRHRRSQQGTHIRPVYNVCTLGGDMVAITTQIIHPYLGVATKHPFSCCAEMM